MKCSHLAIAFGHSRNGKNNISIFVQTCVVRFWLSWWVAIINALSRGQLFRWYQAASKVSLNSKHNHVHLAECDVLQTGHSLATQIIIKEIYKTLLLWCRLIPAQKLPYVQKPYISIVRFSSDTTRVARRRPRTHKVPPNAVDSFYFPFSPISFALPRIYAVIVCPHRSVPLFFFFKYFAIRCLSSRGAIFILHFRSLCVYFQTSANTTNRRRNESLQRTRIVSWKLNCECAQTECARVCVCEMFRLSLSNFRMKNKITF